MDKIFVFSGLGVNSSVFDKIHFDSENVIFVDWIEPRANETLKEYAQRIASIITDDNPILIGLSFGGMVCVEIAKYRKIKQLILIATSKTKYELPILYRILGYLNILNLIPIHWLKYHTCITNWMFGVTNKEEEYLLKTIIKDTDDLFLKWAINAIIKWDNTIIPLESFHIHGNKDKIIPINRVKSNVVINKGGHFMTVNKSNEIEAIINSIIDTTTKLK